MKYIGKAGEHIVLSELLRKGVESYLAIKSNQDDYDITSILSDNHVVRIQVKATELQNKNTNNSLIGTEKNYDYLVIVVFDGEEESIFVLTEAEAKSVRGSYKQMAVSRTDRATKKFVVRSEFEPFRNKWCKITNARESSYGV